MDTQIQKICASLAQGDPASLIKGLVIGYDEQGQLRLYNADMSAEEIVIAVEMAKARALGLISNKELPSAVANCLASREFVGEEHAFSSCDSACSRRRQRRTSNLES
ncbi:MULTISPECIES: hypothetical protein [Pseudoalteromonas]|uniref:Uncharacterized protein n=1 Tax=Pseudoalteromonas peptidolytica F12-50-A1 TaxID=1315280 RepID=A0A8I0MXU9_9GAMM|nr:MULTISPECIES: hypothetical protein [Pseudoalteromonas]MBE0347900.1 hypothetical protein [Pseudoalteromonas peptidolytica F12-50-A1]NLR15300.1 hypothetical protein [Pseudoalteromonas peptidolytica]RRS09138.1 hypothetical protein EAG18_08440 [Pseudoalteromonas sp. J010]RXF00986.1 hypothetical protein D9603_14240 [Pseudoalteromonas sp. PS5]USD31162.1 hypothetical protein J8Z24_21340 [Pseudoalteromonas sp. SCSIO 43201]